MRLRIKLTSQLVLVGKIPRFDYTHGRRLHCRFLFVVFPLLVCFFSSRWWIKLASVSNTSLLCLVVKIMIWKIWTKLACHVSRWSLQNRDMGPDRTITVGKFWNYHKNVTTLSRYNCGIRESVLIIFGTHATAWESRQTKTAVGLGPI